MKRDFMAGSEWLYYKIYCGYGTTDGLLREIIGPLSNSIKTDGFIDHWFFIRYVDPNPHIRWRLHFSDLSALGKTELIIAETLQPNIDTKLINKIQIDTYKREIERYGESTIELCEELFGFDSELITQMLAIIETLPEKEMYRWLFSLKAIDNLLDCFDYDNVSKHTLAKSMADDFGKEFFINEPVIQQFSDKYRKYKAKILNFMQGKDDNANPLYTIIETKETKTRGIVPQFCELCPHRQSLDDIMRSLIHMTMNRIFVAQQRKHEVVLYGFLERYYRSEIAKKKYLEKIDLQN
jgi:thiopeptide-type bacteriocin biosynthesis protein